MCRSVRADSTAGRSPRRNRRCCRCWTLLGLLMTLLLAGIVVVVVVVVVDDVGDIVVPFDGDDPCRTADALEAEVARCWMMMYAFLEGQVGN